MIKCSEQTKRNKNRHSSIPLALRPSPILGSDRASCLSGRPGVNPGDQEAQRSCSGTSCSHGGPPWGGGCQVARESRVVPLPPPPPLRSSGSLSLPRPLASQPHDQPVPSSQHWVTTGPRNKSQNQPPFQHPSCLQSRASGLPPSLRATVFVLPANRLGSSVLSGPH